MSEENVMLGRKVFFLNPSQVMVNGLIEEFMLQEYEIYVVQDHQKLRRGLKKFPESIVFVNIDEGMPEKDWEVWICKVMRDPTTANVQIGILTATANETLEWKYTNHVRVQCGFIVVKTNILPSIRKLYDILQSLNARGRRKYIRVNLENIAATINIPHRGFFIEGTIKDISVVGLSCSFCQDPALKKNTLCPDMQIKLGINLLKAEGIVFGSREEEFSRVYVFLFTQRTDPDMRTRIRKFNHSVLQSRMDACLQ
jgi:hypothetical protein